jgi:hypothetical protein
VLESSEPEYLRNKKNSKKITEQDPLCWEISDPSLEPLTLIEGPKSMDLPPKLLAETEGRRGGTIFCRRWYHPKSMQTLYLPTFKVSSKEKEKTQVMT